MSICLQASITCEKTNIKCRVTRICSININTYNRIPIITKNGTLFIKIKDGNYTKLLVKRNE